MTGSCGAVCSALSVALTILSRAAARVRYMAALSSLGAERLLAARNCEACLYSRTARSSAAAASSTEAKLALSSGVGDAVAVGVGLGAGAEFATAALLADAVPELGNPIVVRPMAMPPMRRSTAAAACNQG